MTTLSKAFNELHFSENSTFKTGLKESIKDPKVKKIYYTETYKKKLEDYKKNKTINKLLDTKELKMIGKEEFEELLNLLQSKLKEVRIHYKISVIGVID